MIEDFIMSRLWEIKNKKERSVCRFFVSVITCIIMVIGILLPSTRSEALTPRVMLSEYEITAGDSSGNIYPGDSFGITFKLKNTSKNKVMNLLCTVSSDAGEFIPDGTGTFYINEIAGEGETELTVNLSSISKLSDKTYKLSIKTEYEDWNGKYEAKDIIYIPIKLKTEVVVSDTYIADEDVRLGDNLEVISCLNNVGGADIYKVMASTAGDNLADANCFVGNVAAGKKANIDIITKATNVSTASTYNNRVIITYEDAEGNQYKEEVMLGDATGHINIIEKDYSDIIQIKEDTSKPMTESVKLLIVLGVVFAVIIVLVIRRAVKRRRLEREFE